MYKCIMRCPGSIDYDALARRGLVTPRDDTDPAQYWLRYGMLPEPIFTSTREVLWYLPESNFTGGAQATILYNEFVNYTFKITATFPHLGSNELIYPLCCNTAMEQDINSW